jgi:Sec-independent protein secretion pathway component TatC
MATFWEHLAELRAILIRCIAAIALGSAVAHYFHESLIW